MVRTANRILWKIDCCIHQYSQTYAWSSYRRCSVSAMYANYDLLNLDTEIKGDCLDLSKGYLLVKYSIVRAVELSWFARI